MAGTFFRCGPTGRPAGCIKADGRSCDPERIRLYFPVSGSAAGNRKDKNGTDHGSAPSHTAAAPL